MMERVVAHERLHGRQALLLGCDAKFQSVYERSLHELFGAASDAFHLVPISCAAGGITAA